MPTLAVTNSSRSSRRMGNFSVSRIFSATFAASSARRDPGQEQDELVAAQAGDGVAVAHARLQALGDLLQQPVAQAVAQGVVDDLEAIEVEEQDGQPRRAAVRLGHRDGEAVVEQQPVGQAGEGVVVGELLDLLLGALALGHVERDPEGGRAAAVLDGAGRRSRASAPRRRGAGS